MSDAIAIARLFSFVREVPPNHGLRVNAIQKWGGGNDGDSWCCFFATMVLDLLYQGNSPIPRGGACQDVYELALSKHWLVTEPQEGDIYLFVNDADHAHHIGFVTKVNPLTGISANTSRDGTSSNGDGVYEHMLLVKPESIRFVRVP